MRTTICCASLIVGAAAATADARPLPAAPVIALMNTEASAAAHQALSKAYDPIHAKTDFFAKRTMNGITIWDVAVKNADGEATAVVTDAGDFLVEGMPVPAAQVPAPVQGVVQNLFKAPARNVSMVKTFEYYVEVKAGSGSYTLHLDATGRLLEIRPKGQGRFDNPSRWPEAAAADKQVMVQTVANTWKGAEAQDVRAADPAAGFYYVTFTKPVGTGWAEMSGKGFVAVVADPIDPAKLPVPATQTISDFFKADQTVAAHQVRQQTFHVEQAANGETVELRIRPNGIIEDVQTLSASSPGH